ncbi:MAG: hypothetical protein K8R89_09775 [Anaerolineae bacterium]|nr:hypothetical protein [Anaerolineae bacterium]
MNIKTFQSLPKAEVAQLVRAAGPQVCVFSINGTRRWFLLEHPEALAENYLDTYLQIISKRYVELYQLFFDHGVDTLVTPIFGPDILERSPEYNRMLEAGLCGFTHKREFLDFYEAYDVRVRVYGDTQRHLTGTPYESALDAIAELEEHTATHQRYRLFFGICAHDAAESVAEIGWRFRQENGKFPTKQEIVIAYYGEYVKPVDFFIGFDRPAVFDMPLIATGTEDLYFTVSPSPYLDAETLRAILYDHLYTRCIDDADYASLTATEWQELQTFYTANRHHVLGVGRQQYNGKLWQPLPQVTLPSTPLTSHAAETLRR